VGIVLAAAGLVAGGAMLAGLGQGVADSKKAAQVAAPVADPAQAWFDAIKTLEGTWTMKDEEGKEFVASVFKVTAAGSVVREIMFPDQPHEMTNMYHLDRVKVDGEARSVVVATHYCAVGNQPRMQCVKVEAPNVFVFEFRDVTNLKSADEGYMGAMTLTIKDADHATQAWTHYKEGKPHGEKALFELVRKK
jgi:hypothetical protein